MLGVKTTIFLGAGATRGAVKGFQGGGVRISPPLNSDFLSIIKKFVSNQKDNSLNIRLDRLVNFLHDEIGITKNRKPSPSMEEIFSLLYSSKDFPEIYKKRRGATPKSFVQVDDFLILATRIFKEIENSSKSRKSKNLYDKLANYLENGDSIITINYDTLMDSALLKHGWDARSGYGLNNPSSKKFIGFSKSKKKTPGLSVELFKLHGSFNWFIKKGKDENLGVLFTKKPSLIYNPGNNRWNEKTNYLRQIIPPIYGKFFSHDFWQVLWKKAFESLLSCEYLVVIGCSLIPTDFHLNALFGRVKAIRKMQKRPFKKVIVIDRDRDKKPQKRFKDILRGSKNKFESLSTFDDFIRQLHRKSR